jgi:hypothetical protein
MSNLLLDKTSLASVPLVVLEEVAFRMVLSHAPISKSTLVRLRAERV